MEKLFGPFGGGDWSSRKSAAIADDCRLQPDGIFVAETTQDGLLEVIGYITTRLDPRARVGFIPNLAVDEAHQGKGIGRALIAHAISFFRERGMEVARIETLEKNTSGRALYPKLGFQEVARQIHFAMKLT
jgi:ribosomal protein S18 acetylase RimI-like enzyme